MKDIVASFKNELRNYNYHLSELKAYNDQIDALEYKMQGVKGVDPSKQRGSLNESAIAERRHELSARIDDLKAERSRIEANINYVGNILCLMPREVQNACILIYAKRQSFSKVAMQTYRSVGSLQRLIDTSIETAINRYRYRLKQ